MVAAPQQFSSEIGNFIIERKIFDGYGRWVYLRWLDVCVCVPNKNGGEAFRNKICDIQGWDIARDTFAVMMEFHKSGDGPFSPSETEAFYPDTPHYLSVREPVDRFASLWRNKCRDTKNTPSLFGKTPDELMDHIEANPEGNSHWFRQSGYLTNKTQCIAYDDLFSFLGWPYSAKNVTTSHGEDMPVDRILAHYSEDRALH